MTPPTGRTGGFPFIRVVLLLWTGMYLWMMSRAGWPWAVEHPSVLQRILGFGSLPTGTLTQFGSAVPDRIHAGEWQRLFTGAALHESAVSLLLAGWWWASIANGMRTLVGLGGVIFVMIVGGAAGNVVHAQVYPDTPYAGPGPFGWVVALIGLQLGLGLFGKLPKGSHLVYSSIFSLLFVGVLTWALGGAAAFEDEWFRPRLGLEALGTSFVVGALLPLLLGARGFARRASPAVKPLAWIAVLVWVSALAIQMPRTVRAGEASAVKSFLKALQDAEIDARGVFDDGRDARRFQRTKLHEGLDAVRDHPFVQELGDAALLRAYIKAMRPIATGDMPDPHAVLVRCRRALKVWHDKVEQKLRRDYGLPPRAPHRLRRWDGL